MIRHISMIRHNRAVGYHTRPARVPALARAPDHLQGTTTA